MAKKKAEENQQQETETTAEIQDLYVDVYSYHPETGEYIGTVQAFADPLTPGEYLIPAHATDEAPPAAEAGKVRQWNGEAWVLQTIPEPEPEPEAPEPTPEESAAAARTERTSRLFACDWTALADVPMSTAQRSAWITYRQQLRDVPQQAGFPITIVWPELPE